jgi:hypothetical protein
LKPALLAFVLGITSLVPVLDSSSAFGQDDAVAQEQRLTQQSFHSMEEAQRLTDEAERQTMQQAQIMADNASNAGPSIPLTSPPKFSVKSGGVKTGTTVSISCPTPNAVIYYTTTGWTPTTSSRRYTGPITLLASTQLQAFAAVPTMANSTYASASYTVKGPPLTVFPLTIGSDDVLHAKTRLHLVTNSTLSSKKATIGEKIPIVLDQDVKVGDSVEIPKGTSVDATITAVTRSGLVGMPGSISFAVHSLAVNGTTVALQGGERLDGVSHTTRAVLLWVTFVGSIPSVMMHGGEGEIKPGMRFTAAVATDTPLKPAVPTQ